LFQRNANRSRNGKEKETGPGGFGIANMGDIFTQGQDREVNSPQYL